MVAGLWFVEFEEELELISRPWPSFAIYQRRSERLQDKELRNGCLFLFFYFGRPVIGGW